MLVPASKPIAGDPERARASQMAAQRIIGMREIEYLQLHEAPSYDRIVDVMEELVRFTRS